VVNGAEGLAQMVSGKACFSEGRPLIEGRLSLRALRRMPSEGPALPLIVAAKPEGW